MALVKVDDRPAKRRENWANRDKRAGQHPLPKISDKPVVDYSKLGWLCSIPGLKDRNNAESSEDAHQLFMENYKSMFVPPPKKIGFPVHSLVRCGNKGSETSLLSKYVGDVTATENRRSVEKQYEVDNLTYDIRDYLPLLHKQRRSEDPVALRSQRIKTLRKLLKKLPFHRTAADNDKIFSIVKNFPSIAGQVSAEVLKELCVIAVLESWKDCGITVFGNTGFHLLLKGSVQPLTDPYFKLTGEDIEFCCPTPEPIEKLDQLGIGASFGTLERIQGREPNSRILTVQTSEPNTEMMKISASDYSRVVEQIVNRDQTEKMNLLQSCKGYKVWSKQPLGKVANLMTWEKFPPNTVLISEGYKAPFLGYIKSGECHVMRQVEILHTLPNGKQEKKLKQVVMGKFGAGESFGENSVISMEPITCSIVTATKMEMACIKPERLDELDDVTVQLLHQSSSTSFGDLTQDDIHEEYIQQELKREWNEYKHSVVVNALNTRGIRPGYGKWSK